MESCVNNITTNPLLGVATSCAENFQKSTKRSLNKTKVAMNGVMERVKILI